jgi:catalase
MPLPNDEKLIALSEEILKQFEAMFGSHPGFRPGHVLIDGTPEISW